MLLEGSDLPAFRRTAHGPNSCIIIKPQEETLKSPFLTALLYNGVVQYELRG